MSDKLVLTVKTRGVVLTSEPIHQGAVNMLIRGLQRMDPELTIIMVVPVDLLGIDEEEPKDGPDIEESGFDDDDLTTF